MGNDSLKVIAHELLVSLKGSVSVDWSHRESERARMRVLVKRILRKHGYPPRSSGCSCADSSAPSRGSLVVLGNVISIVGLALVGPNRGICATVIVVAARCRPGAATIISMFTPKLARPKRFEPLTLNFVIAERSHQT
jgi:hypothetical protein